MPQLRSAKRKAVVLSSDEDSTQSKAPSRSSRSSQPRAKPQPQPKERNILSFFNAATQRQRVHGTQDQPVASQGLPPTDTVEDQDDTIQDDSLDDEPNKSGAHAAWRKRTRTRGAAGDAENPEQDALPSASQKFLKTLSSQSRPAARIEDDERPWVERYSPANLDELAVHKRKVADVKAWLTNVLSGRERKRLLVLKGAAGTAKTTTVNLLAKDVGFEINEWKNPMGSDFSSDAFVSLSAQFEDFMGRSKFGSLDLGPSDGIGSQSSPPNGTGKQIVLIEEFPNTFTRSSAALQSFRSAIEQYLSSSVPSLGAMFTRSADAPPPTPIVMIISETLLSTNTAAADSFTAHRLLGPEISNHPGTTIIEFNPIAPTFLTKALELVVAKEARKSGRKTTPGPQVIKQLSEIGDVRSAISSLEFLCVRGDDNADWGSRVTFKAVKKGARQKPMTKMEQESMALVSQRESTLGIFHAVGKVVYNKRDESSNSAASQPPAYFPEYRRPKASEIDVDALMDELGTDIQTFISALHENYVLSCNTGSEEDTLDSINGCIDALSDADLLSPAPFSSAGTSRRTYQSSSTDSLQQDEMSFHASVRGLLFSLPHPVNRSAPPPGTVRGRGSSRADAHKMFYPTSLRLWRLQEEIEGLLDLYIRRAQTDGLNRAETFAHLPKRGTVESWNKRLSLDASRHDNNSSSNTTAAADITQQDSVMATPLGSSGSLKREMLLERLPYSAVMLRQGNKKQTSNVGGPAARLSEVEKITSFSGVGIGADDGVADGDEGDDEDVLRNGGDQWSTDGPTEHDPSSTRPARPGSRRRLVGGAGAGVSGTGTGTSTSTSTSTGRGRGAATATLHDDHTGEMVIGTGGEKGLANLVLSDDDIEDDDDD
ncbi:cell cycle checkpoint protein [Diplodia corticola]|uniref:Cell cycle checkpoint protein n=1 Tax=Diplodia corticola TaxID=236234 RepID=A0A1J9RPK2_9PEZI|nr:cell cycle checkpoint protein [Diplodia corticola]OJD29844.1 cell cycle checkpoint protein [Diplodia corticola]